MEKGDFCVARISASEVKGWVEGCDVGEER